MTPDDVSGWFSRDEGRWYAAQAARLRPGAVLVEVGSWKGRSTAFVGPTCRERGVRLVCVDAWAGSKDEHAAAYLEGLAREDVRAVFDETLRRFDLDVEVLHMTSLAAAAHVGPGRADLVFLDASHDEASVAADLAAWSIVLRAGGTLAGHDWHEPGVTSAVHAFAMARGLRVERGAGSTWRLPRSGASAV